MWTMNRLTVGLCVVGLGVLTGCPAGVQDPFQDTFDVDKADLGPDGGNEFFSLEVGKQLVLLENGLTVIITVLDETRVVDEVTTRVVEERESQDGELIEVSRNYFAADSATNDVYYFGEDVDDYENGVVVGHSGAWRAGQNGARFGLIMPADPQVGDRYYQEVAPTMAMDRAEHLSLTESITTPAGTFQNCLLVEETTPLESDVSEKVYCPGVGLVRDNDAVLQAVATP